MSDGFTISDDRLLAELRELVQNGRVLDAPVLRHLGEVDERRLYLREGCSAMFRYCVDVLLQVAAAEAERMSALVRTARSGNLFSDRKAT